MLSLYLVKSLSSQANATECTAFAATFNNGYHLYCDVAVCMCECRRLVCCLIFSLIFIWHEYYIIIYVFSVLDVEIM